ncbi:MAG TPA: malto-oligosyltrehalose synthase, partial [Candidatus Saccharimonadales bacterium]|nr:malto-oligosyltrehalose synthase [Candidatus Saccharimonadales bacterium]
MDNPWWWDVLEDGPASRYADVFDVEWDPPEARHRDRILLPVLADHYGRLLASGDLRLVRRGGDFRVAFGDRELPMAPESLSPTLGEAARRSGSTRLAFLADVLSALPQPTATDRSTVARRHRDKAIVGEELSRIVAEQPKVAEAVDEVISEVNADPDALHEMLERQNYRLARWQMAGSDLGYRRFFDVSTLIGLRMEDERVFEETHALILQLVAQGSVDGLRVDHPDGLRDPGEYLRRLRARVPSAWIVVEKILEPGEDLRPSWPVAGTTGYDFLNQVMGLFVDPAGARPLSDLYVSFTGEDREWPDLVRETKHLVLRDILGSDLNRLTALWLAICECDRLHRDYARHELHQTLREVLADVPVYRTYVQADHDRVDEVDVRYVNQAIDLARELRPDLDSDLLGFLRDLLLLRVGGDLGHEFAMRFQQLTGPVMAKGVEDTAFYGFNRLIALNEVGGDPGRLGLALSEFHTAMERRQRDWPAAMLAGSTHDTKRSEDVRARLVLLAEMPDRWGVAVRQWAAMNERHRVDGTPDRNDEYYFYQTLVGAWPIEADRVLAHAEKAIRESKRHTSWTAPDPAYEAGVRAFLAAILDAAAFVANLEAFVASLLPAARMTSLSQTLIRLTAPGVPDLYQGSELWDLSLADPDNRRAVDWELRRRLLGEAIALGPEEALVRTEEGLPKLWLIHRALEARRRRPKAFGPDGAYRGLEAAGPHAHRVVAFLRGEDVISIAPRFVLGLDGEWPETTLELPPGRWCDALTGVQQSGGVQHVRDLLGRFPVALLLREST